MPVFSGLSGSRLLIFSGVCVLIFFSSGAGCQEPEPESIRSYLEGTITGPVSLGGASGDPSGLRVLVVETQGRAVDTLGHAVTDSDGTFSMTVQAATRGVYPLMVWGPRGEKRLATTDYVVADGDSGTLTVEFPVQAQPVRVRSQENKALAAYRNTIAQHRRVLQERLRADTGSTNAMSRGVRQTSSMLWSLQNNFPETYASEFGAAESLSLLSGWDDSLIVERAQTIDPSSARYVDVACFAFDAKARLHSQFAALELLEEFESRALTDAQRAGLQSIRVRAFVDSHHTEAARSAAQDLRNEYPETKWAEWSKRIGHEITNLRSGSPAPSLQLRTMAGDSLSLRALRGRPVVLEYYRPGSEVYRRQLGTRKTLYRSTRADSVAFISISVEPDTLIYEAFARSRAFPGRQVIAPGGRDDPIVTAYNIAEIPTRVLIDSHGDLVGRYPDAAFFALQEDLAQLLQK